MVMLPKDFTENWKGEDESLMPISLQNLEKFNLLPETKEFLTIAGLPTYASPYLSFVSFNDDSFRSINKLTDLYDFCSEDDNKYVVIGWCRDGDAIAVNTDLNDTIEELDHGDLFRPMFFNSSIQSLASFLIIYRDFERSVIEEHGEEGFKNSYFTDIQFEEMRERMVKEDSIALIEAGFWKDELEILLSLRQEYMDNV